MALSKKELIEFVAANHDLTKTQAEHIVSDVFARIESELEEGGEVSINGFGKFSVKQSAARTGRNPSTGAPLEIAAKKSVKFAASKTLKDTLNQ